MTNHDHVRRAKANLDRMRASKCPPTRAVWIRDDGRLQIGRSGDVVTMLDDLGRDVTSH